MAGTDPGRRALGFVALLALGINGIVGVGIFFTPDEVGRLVPGLAGVGVYAVTAAALAPVAFLYATLGARFDEDGGPYVWARAAFGPQVAYFVGWIAYTSALFSTAAVITGLAEHAGPDLGFAGPTLRRVFSVVCVGALVTVAATGLRPSAMAWTGITVVKLLPLLLLAVLGVAVSEAAPALPAPRPTTAVDFGRAVLIVVFATQGFEVVPVPAGHARRESRAVPMATVGSLVAAALLYVVLHTVCVRALPGLAESATPLADAARVYGGATAHRIVAVGTNVSALGIAFGMFAMSPRYLSALGNDQALGPWLGVEDRRSVPQRALWITAAAALALSLAGNLTELFALSSIAVLAQYGVSAAALVVLAWRRERGLRPANLWPAPLALVAIALVASSAKAVEIATWGGVLALGAAVLFLRRRGSGT